MIINIGKLSLWAGNIPLTENVYVPRPSYLNGGCYWKVSLLWFKFLLELSGPKKDKCTYKVITLQELDKILKHLS